MPYASHSDAEAQQLKGASTFLVSAENAPFLQQVSHDTTRPLSDYLIKSYIHLRHDSKINYSASTSRPWQRSIPLSAQPPWTSRAAQSTDRTQAQTLTWSESGQGVDSQGWSASPRWTTYRQFWGWSTVREGINKPSNKPSSVRPVVVVQLLRAVVRDLR